MIQYICNRCGKKLSDFGLYEVLVTHKNNYSAEEDDNDNHYHLCRDCRQRLEEFMEGKVVPGYDENGKWETNSPIYDGDYPSSFCEVVDHEDADSGANANYVEVEHIKPANAEKVRNTEKVFEPRYVGDIAEGPRDRHYIGDRDAYVGDIIL